MTGNLRPPVRGDRLMSGARFAEIREQAAALTYPPTRQAADEPITEAERLRAAVPDFGTADAPGRLRGQGKARAAELGRTGPPAPGSGALLTVGMLLRALEDCRGSVDVPGGCPGGEDGYVDVVRYDAFVAALAREAGR